MRRIAAMRDEQMDKVEFRVDRFSNVNATHIEPIAKPGWILPRSTRLAYSFLETRFLNSIEITNKRRINRLDLLLFPLGA